MLDPDVVRLDDNGKRKVMLRFCLDGFQLEVVLKKPDELALDLIRAGVWVSEG